MPYPMKNSVLLFALLIIGFFPKATQTLYAQDKFVSIEELDSKKDIKTKFKGKGGYSGNCVTLIIENLTTDTAFVWVEPGRRLDNPDETKQDILIVKEQKIKLLPRQEIKTEVFGFCCQASNGSPSINTEFKIGQMADENLQWIANILDKNPFSEQTIQQAIWVFSNGHSAASIVSDKNQKIMSLRRAISSRLKISMPWYDIHYKKDAQVFSGKHEKVTGEVKFYSNNNGTILINVRKENGLLMSTVANDVGIYGRSYNFPLSVTVEDWDPGKYFVNVYLDGNLKHRQEFQL
jgi:hypothetical protein